MTPVTSGTIVTVTLNPALDMSACVDRVAPDRKLRCARPRYDPGGGGINVARAIGKLGGDAMALWCAGGPPGELLKQLLDEEGVPQLVVPVRELTRTNMTIEDESTGHQWRFGFPGAELAPDEAERVLEEVADLDPAPDWLVLSGSLPPGVPDDFYARIAERAAGARVVLDTSGPALRAGIDRGVHLLKPNLRELGQLAGREVTDEEHAIAAAQELVSEGRVEIVVVSAGAGGALLVADGVVERVRAPTVPIRSRVGAGDSMLGGLVLRLAEGAPLREAVCFGVAAGAAAVMTPGTELCRRQDAQRIFGLLCPDAAKGQRP